jgi:hypothetical protein
MRSRVPMKSFWQSALAALLKLVQDLAITEK